MNRPIVALMLASSAFTLSACGGTPPVDLYDPYLDLSVVLTGNTEGGLIDDQTSAFVSDINGQYTINTIELVTGAGIGDDGKVVAAQADVLVIEFVSKGEITLTSLDERNIRLLLELDREGKVVNGYFGGTGSGIAALARSFPRDSFVKGQAWFILRDKEFAVGQLDVLFHGHRISGNFRVLVRAR